MCTCSCYLLFVALLLCCFELTLGCAIRPREDRQDTGGAGIIVCTDIAARGIDYDASVAQVIQFDLPFSLEDQVHRMGRTCRVPGSTGRVFTIVGTSTKEAALPRR